MHLIAPLTSGIAGAEDGFVFIRSRGTSSLAACYSDFEGTVLSQPTAGLPLDSLGGYVVYVNELVDVEVVDPEGNPVRAFTAGDAAPDVEVRSLAFTGIPYDGGASGAGEPTTLQVVLDRALTSFGAPDWEVPIGGVDTTIKDAIQAFSGIFRNVKAAQYGAIGDGATDDTVAIQAALDAGPGIVWFPEGTYKTTSKLTVPVAVSLWGAGSSSSNILTYHATADGLEFGSGFSNSYQEIRGLLVAPGQSNSGKTVSITNAGTRRVWIVNSIIGDSFNTGSTVVVATGNHWLLVDASTVYAGGDTDTIAISSVQTGVRVEVRNSRFIAVGVAGAWSSILINGRNLKATACVFDTATSILSGSYVCIFLDGTAGAGPNAVLVGNEFLAGTGTNGAIQLSNANDATTRFVEAGNIFGAFTSPWSGLTAQSAGPAIQSVTRQSYTYALADTNTASLNVKADVYGTTFLTRSAAGAQTLTTTVGPPGSFWTLVLYNHSGGALGTVTMGSGFVAGTPPITSPPADTKILVWEFQAVYDSKNAAAAWVPVAASVTALG